MGSLLLLYVKMKLYVCSQRRGRGEGVSGCGITVISSSRITLRGLDFRLKGSTHFFLGKATHGNGRKGGLVTGMRPSLLFLSIRLPSVAKVRLLRRVHSDIS